MKLKIAINRIALAAAVMLLASCGGGSSDSSSSSGSGSDTGTSTPTPTPTPVPVPDPALAVSGTAATGAALASASVQLKCKAGEGTATTNSSGGYTVSISRGELPCIIKVSGTSSAGAAVTLHSVVESGSAGTDNTTTATANVTPVTEMILAQLLAGKPSDAFDAFNPALVTQQDVAAAATAIVNALKAAGVDLSGIDPLKAALVPATGSTAGNAYDQLLDTLGDKVTPESLPLVINQIATAAASDSTEGLTNAMGAVAGGSLANCPSAISGKYRVIDFLGATQVVQLDFAKMKVTADGSELAMTANSVQACEVSVADGNGTVVVFGSSGVGLIKDNATTGYVFPVQSLAHADVTGEWNFVESGKDEGGALVKFMGKLGFKADRGVTLCEYDVDGGITSTCAPDSETGTIVDGTDGGLVLNLGDFPARFYGYRTPAGTLTLFGTNNPAGNTGAIMQSHFVAYKGGAAVSLPVLDSARQSWNLLMRQATSTGPLLSSMTAEVGRIKNVDTANSTYSRVFDSAPDVTDVFKINTPLTGLSERTNRAYVYVVPIPGTGVTIAVDAPNNPAFLYSTTLPRP